MGISNKRIDAEYYISRVLIPPLERIFNLIGADVRSWYYVMMKGPVSDNTEAVLASPEKPGAEDVFRGEDMKEEERAGIDSHYRSSQCALCRTSTDEGKQDASCLHCMINVPVPSRMSVLQTQPARIFTCIARPFARG